MSLIWGKLGQISVLGQMIPILVFRSALPSQNRILMDKETYLSWLFFSQPARHDY